MDHKPDYHPVAALVASALISITTLLFIAGPAGAQLDPCYFPPARPFPNLDVPKDLAIDDPVHTPDACATWRWVAVKKDRDAPCPDPGLSLGEESGLLFKPDLDDLENDDPALLPPVLRPFCVYDSRDAGPAARRKLNKKLERLVRSGELLEVVSSCAAVAPAADELPERWAALQERFLAEAGGFAPPPTSLATGLVTDTAASVAPSTRVAVLDTQPSNLSWKTGKSRHGLGITRLIKRLVCVDDEGSRCAARVTPSLALPIVDFSWNHPREVEFDPVGGGYFGTIDQLSRAVWRELEANPKDGRLVLNLAVGWVGDRFGGKERCVSQMPAPVRALYRVLQVASCQGVLAIAAAGNRFGGPLERTGPLLPGGWETHPAPKETCPVILGTASEEEIAALGSAEPRAEPGAEPGAEPDSCRPEIGELMAGEGEPLVYAVAGVRSDGSPLANSRLESTPPRVAHGDHAVIPGRSPEEHVILTGSSVATGVLSAAAAAVWTHRSELGRAEVMEILQRSGEDLGRPAEVYLGDDPPLVHRVSVCKALEAACEDGWCEASGYRCGETAERRLAAVEFPPPCRGVDFDPRHAIDAGQLTEKLEDNGFCEEKNIRFAGKPPRNPCPLRQFFAIQARPWTGPQPTTDPCQGCEIRPPPPVWTGGGELYQQSAGEPSAAEPEEYWLKIDVDSAWPGGDLMSPVLRIGNEAFDLGIERLKPGNCVLVRGIPPEFLAPDANGSPPVAVRFLVNDKGRRGAAGVVGAFESPVFVAP